MRSSLNGLSCKGGEHRHQLHIKDEFGTQVDSGDKLDIRIKIELDVE